MACQEDTLRKTEADFRNVAGMRGLGRIQCIGFCRRPTLGEALSVERAVQRSPDGVYKRAFSSWPCVDSRIVRTCSHRNVLSARPGKRPRYPDQHGRHRLLAGQCARGTTVEQRHIRAGGCAGRRRHQHCPTRPGTRADVPQLKRLCRALDGRTPDGVYSDNPPARFSTASAILARLY